MKKVTLLVLAMALVLSPLFIESSGQQKTAEAGTNYSDVQPSQQDAIQRLSDQNIISGYPDGTFRPNQEVTRAEAVSMLGRVLGFSSSGSSFPDVDSNHYASGHIAGAVEEGIVAGYPDGTFRPTQTVSRAEMAIFLTRGFNLSDEGGEANFWDVYPGVMGASAITDVAEARIAAGYPDGSFKPTRGITRYEFVLFLDRTLHESERTSGNGQSGLQGMQATSAVVNAPAAGALNVRPYPGTDNTPIGRVTHGDEIDYYETIDNWALIDYNGEFGFVSLSYLRSANGSLAGKTIVVDPGHGGHDPGAGAFGIQEKDVVLDTGNYLRPMLEDAGANVIMTRSTDTFVTLNERANIANRQNADAFISIHANAAGSSAAHGTETYWDNSNASAGSQALAASIQRELVAELGTLDRGVKQAGFSVIRRSQMPSVLVELGFVTNQNEANRLNSSGFQQRAAEAITRGTINHFE
ncbi:N-acetylmuramoyl-L-alanine amidase [Salsuginibacillus kocurii]|uniref:N-acetylmuramoyl-L-alanine amidase n=1 Tax=Salsuginibacillus kocurii TaxID=427078 RepID=UPI00035C3F99|nr:N-acetylmuramoyl-L-alanine amidase [Salsuginibacillus kocurii]